MLSTASGSKHCALLRSKLATVSAFNVGLFVPLFIKPGDDRSYSLSNVIVADEKILSFHQYLRYSYNRGTIEFSTPSAIK